MPTVAEAADAAEVSRATAYRYFPSQAALLFGTYDELMPMMGPTVFDSDDAFERLDQAVHMAFDAVLRYEPFMRATLRQALEDWATARAGSETAGAELPRGGRRHVIDAALAVVEGQLDPQKLQQVKATVAALVGIEGHIVMRDIYGMPPEAALETVRCAARATLAAALDDRSRDLG